MGTRVPILSFLSGHFLRDRGKIRAIATGKLSSPTSDMTGPSPIKSTGTHSSRSTFRLASPRHLPTPHQDGTRYYRAGGAEQHSGCSRSDSSHLRTVAMLRQYCRHGTSRRVGGQPAGSTALKHAPGSPDLGEFSNTSKIEARTRLMRSKIPQFSCRNPPTILLIRSIGQQCARRPLSSFCASPLLLLVS